MAIFEVQPSNTTGCAGDITRFICSSTISSSHLFWFVNDKPVNALPKAFNASSLSYKSRGGRNSTLQILGLGETNNSIIICAVDASDRISNFSVPVFFTGELLIIIIQ